MSRGLFWVWNLKIFDIWPIQGRVAGLCNSRVKVYVTTKIERHRQSNYSFGLVMCCFRDFLKVKGKILKALSCTDAKIIRLKIDIAVTVIHRLFLRWCGVRQNFLRCCGVHTPQCHPPLDLLTVWHADLQEPQDKPASFDTLFNF